MKIITSTFFALGLLLYTVKEIWFDLYTLLENRIILSFCSLTNFDNSRLFPQIFPIVVIFCVSSFDQWYTTKIIYYYVTSTSCKWFHQLQNNVLLKWNWIFSCLILFQIGKSIYYILAIGITNQNFMPNLKYKIHVKILLFLLQQLHTKHSEMLSSWVFIQIEIIVVIICYYFVLSIVIQHWDILFFVYI